MEQLYTFTVFTENRVGLLNQISISSRAAA